LANEILKPIERFNGGIADYSSEGIQDSYAFGRSVDVRTDPRQVTILPRTIKESGTVITDLPKWSEESPSDGSLYMYGNTGNLYKRTSAGAYSLLRSVPNSHGNGLVYSAEDDFLYYAGDKVIGRYGKLSGTPTFVDDFFGSQGGVPLNTNSLDLEAGSSQYASRADTASLSITGNLSIEAQVYPESLPASGGQMTLVSKWTENGNIRSYKFGIGTVSNYFGDGSDGALTISSNTTEAPIDSACTGTSGTSSLSATNASFTTGQIILIHQSRGTGAGTWQKNKIQSYTAGTITLVDALNATYTSGAQVRVLKQYTNVTINSGITYTAKAWNGTVGGIIGFLASGTVTVTGTITASGKGFRGATQITSTDTSGKQGEGTSGAADTESSSYNGNGGGGGYWAPGNNGTGGGGGGGNSSAGTRGQTDRSGTGGAGGIAAGSADLTTMVFGGGGGSGALSATGSGGAGGIGGGICWIAGTTVTITGSVTSAGTAGNNGSIDGAGGGGGAGGSNMIKSQVATLGSSLVTAGGGSGGTSEDETAGDGGAGSTGRNHLDYYTSYTGTTSPTLNVTQDNSLGSVDGYTLMLSVSSNGTNSENLTKPATITTGVWQHVAVAWTASTSTATFYLNGVSLGSTTGALTAISDNASVFNIGCDFDGAGAAQHFYDGLIDEVRVFNTVRSASDFVSGMTTQISTNTTGLAAYYKLNDDVNDSTANANNLTASGSPVFTTNVPFASPTTRLDIDQQATTSGNTYTTPTAISEASTARKTFTPNKDPQKSIAVLVAAVGTGNWTLTVHDSLNNVIATKTVTNADMTTGYYEFTFSSVWRPLTNFTNAYHFHITSTVADGTVTTTTASDLESVSYRTYYQFLVEDTSWHPGLQFLNFIVFGNERHVAKFEYPLYEPNKIVLAAGYKVRCLELWREYLAIGVTKGDDLNNQGRIYFWDGYSPTFNTFIEIPQGGVNALLSSEGKLFIWAGPQQQQLVFVGGDTAEKIKELPLIGDDAAEVYPGAVCMWNSLIRFGVSGSSTSTAIGKGVYTYGSTNRRYQDILTYDYPISTGNTGSTVSIGLVTKVGNRLLIGWQDNVSYGVDYLLTTNAPYPTATMEFLVDESNSNWKEKELTEIVANFDPLLTGESINIKFKRDADSDWIANTNDPAVGDEVVRLLTTKGRYNSMQVAIDMTTSVSTSPTLNSVLAIANSNQTEGRYG